MIDFLEANGFGEETFGDWFGGSASEAGNSGAGNSGASGMAVSVVPMMAVAPQDMFQAEVFG